MSVCQFYLNGNCRYGDKCFKKHPGSSKPFGSQAGYQRNVFSRPGNSQNSFAPLARLGENQTVYASRTVGAVQNDNQKTVELIRSNLHTWETGKMWPLSCFGYQTEKPCISGLEDYSPEELRVEAYKAKETGSAVNYTNEVSRLVQASNARKRELSALTVNGLLQEEQNASRQNQSPNLFTGQMATNRIGTVFGNNSGNFGHSESATFAPGSHPQRANTITTPLPFYERFPQSPAQPQNSASQNPFLTNSARLQSTFVSQQATGLTQTVIEGPGTRTQESSFERKQNPFSQSGSATLIQPIASAGSGSQSSMAGMTMQSSQDSRPNFDPRRNSSETTNENLKTSLSEKDLLAFKAERFILGQIPESAPPPELC